MYIGSAGAEDVEQMDIDKTMGDLRYNSELAQANAGGCALHIYTSDGASWRQVSELTIVDAPVRLLATRTRGWRDLAVSTRGGGMDLPRLTRVRFDGADYSRSAPLARGVRGRLLLDDATPGRPLFR